MRLNLKINSDPEINVNTKLALIDQNEITAVTILIANVSNELRTLLMLKNPRNIDEATSLVINHSLIEQQINLRHTSNNAMSRPVNNKNRHNHSIPHVNPTQFNSHPKHYGNQNFSNYQNIPHQTQTYNIYQTPSQFRNVNNQFNKNQGFPNEKSYFQQNNVPRKYPTNEQVFGKPPNVFTPKNIQPNNKPEPMSTTSRVPSTRNHNYNHFKRTGQPNFTFKELTNSEINDHQHPVIDEINDYESQNNYHIDNNPIYYSQNDEQHSNYYHYHEYNEPQSCPPAIENEDFQNQNFFENKPPIENP
ncbi:hypothetical protein HHI36_013157 [Cryptolaemus montrouzieri]|uniref:GATA zinc finger domain-containing protein 14-like n=1 Tax=Cryptolaemus montrouzieri TaxID=559131 RepID=A0ABD2NGH4_9CUCU